MKRYIVIFVLALSAAVSCRKADVPAGQQWGSIRLMPVFTGIEPQVSTKGAFAAIAGVNFEFEGSIFVYNTGTKVPHVQGYNNMKAMVEATWDPAKTNYDFMWMFYPNGVQTSGLPEIGVLKGVPVDVYAYVPYNPSFQDLTAIPFNTAEQDDIMFASALNVQVNSLEASSPQQLVFRHSMACITLKVRSKRFSEHYFSELRIRDAGNNYLAYKGTVNVMDGSVSSPQYSDQWIVVEYEDELNVSTSRDSYFTVLVPPVKDYNDSKGIELCLKSRVGVETERFFLPLPPAESDGTHPFKAGYEYIYDVTLDDFVMISPNVYVVGYDTIPTISEIEF